MLDTFDYTLGPGGAVLARAYGDCPVLCLPQTLPGPKGPLPLAGLGGYCFAETVRDKPKGPLLRCVRERDGSLRTVPAEEGQDLHPAAGRFLRRSPCPAPCGRSAAAPFTTAGPCAGSRWGAGRWPWAAMSF